MRTRAVVCVVVAVCALTASSATADNFSGGGFLVFFGSDTVKQIASWDLPARFEGSVTVTFDGGFGSGRDVWTPGRDAQLTVDEFKTRQGIRYEAFLASTGDHAVISRVDRPGGICTDIQSNVFDQAVVEQGTTKVHIGLAGPTPGAGGFHMTDSRCGGPLVDDVGRALTLVPVSVAKLRKGGFDIDLRANAPLSVPGMSGTVASSVILHVGKRKPARRTGGGAVPGGTPSGPLRKIDVSYDITRVSGSIPATATGSEPDCADLDSCGVSETLALSMNGFSEGQAGMTALDSRKRPLRDLRTAVGLARGGNSRGVQTFGFANWNTRTTTLAASAQRDGAPVCSDTRHVPSFDLQLNPTASTLKAQLTSTAEIRTACPGPSVSEGPAGGVIASGSVPLSNLRNKRLVLHLTRGEALDTEGWSGRTKPDVTIVLTRKRVKITNVHY